MLINFNDPFIFWYTTGLFSYVILLYFHFTLSNCTIYSPRGKREYINTFLCLSFFSILFYLWISAYFLGNISALMIILFIKQTINTMYLLHRYSRIKYKYDRHRYSSIQYPLIFTNIAETNTHTIYLTYTQYTPIPPNKTVIHHNGEISIAV